MTIDELRKIHPNPNPDLIRANCPDYYEEAYRANALANGMQFTSIHAAEPGTELDLQSKVIAFLRTKGLFIGVANPCVESTYTVGWPDLTFPYMGKFVGIELKSRTGKLSPAQQAAHFALKMNGAHIFVCRSLEDVEAALREVGK